MHDSWDIICLFTVQFMERCFGLVEKDLCKYSRIMKIAGKTFLIQNVFERHYDRTCLQFLSRSTFFFFFFFRKYFMIPEHWIGLLRNKNHHNSDLFLFVFIRKDSIFKMFMQNYVYSEKIRVIQHLVKLLYAIKKVPLSWKRGQGCIHNKIRRLSLPH